MSVEKKIPLIPLLSDKKGRQLYFDLGLDNPEFFTNDFSKLSIRALSWKQPFADLMLFDKIETRTWSTKYRGWVLICASKTGYSVDQINKISGVFQEQRIIDVLEKYYDTFEKPINIKDRTGHAIAIGKLVDCRPMRKTDENACFVKYKEPWTVTPLKKNGEVGKEKKKQLWCHIYDEVIPIVPFAWKGSQGWRELTADQKKQIIIQ